MRKILLALSLVLILCDAATAQYRRDGVYSGLYDSETVASFKSHVGYITSSEFEGRKAGSPGEEAVAHYVYDVLKDYGVDMLCSRDGDIFGIESTPGDTLRSRNIIGFVQGYDKNVSGKYIVVGARMDNLGINEMRIDGEKVSQIYAGANGNASGLAMMLELARMVSTNSVVFRRSVIFVAFGASTQTCAGSWYFLNNFSDSDKIETMINLDMLGTGTDGFYAYTASNTDLNTLLTKLSGDLQPVLPQVRGDEPYPSDHRAFYAKEIPAIFFTTGKYPEHNTPRDVPSILDYDMMEKELEYIYNCTVALANSDSAARFRNSSDVQKTNPAEGIVAYYDCDYRPMFLNSPDPGQFLEKWVYQYLKYPQKAIEQGIQGTVHVNFVIDETGKVTDVKVSRSVDPLLDEEAVRVVSASPKWRPGRLRGQKVKTSMTIPVEFRLEQKTAGPKFGIKK